MILTKHHSEERPFVLWQDAEELVLHWKNHVIVEFDLPNSSKWIEIVNTCPQNF
jgi:hypothetical protein